MIWNLFCLTYGIVACQVFSSTVCLVFGSIVCLVFSSIVCLVCSSRYWFLAASRLVARFARVRALRARCGPFGPAAGPSGPQTVAVGYPYPLINALEGGGGIHIYMSYSVLRIVFLLVYTNQFYCMSSCRNLVCLGCSFRYWFLAASRLVARFARVRALRARCGRLLSANNSVIYMVLGLSYVRYFSVSSRGILSV